ncbi:NAD(P)-binding domain-containing protein [Pseudomonas hunanensis]|uniref:NAD(P)-binding domain-containing protein n=1 Tax=Pseudomonas hunanensis TaxID=1247546 RepID=UPI0037FCC24E
MTIGYIGLGAMGSALARQLLAHHPLQVCDLNQQAVATLAAQGAHAVPSLTELAQECSVILLCLPRSANVEQVLFGPGGLYPHLREGTLIIDQTSGIPAQTRAFADRLRARGCSLVDAPVAGGVPAAQAGTITIMLAGQAADCARALPVLQMISPRVYHCSERVGDGQALKLVNNIINAGYRISTLELVALGRKLGVPLAVLSEALNTSWAQNFTSRHLLTALLEGRPSSDFALQLMIKDLNQALSLGLEVEAAMPMGSLARSVMQMALSLLGEQACLDDLVGFSESLAGVRLVDGLAAVQGEAPEGRWAMNGVGIVGRQFASGAFVRRLLAEQTVQVCDLPDEWMQAFARDGAKPVTCLSTLFADNPVVIACGLDSEQLLAQLPMHGAAVKGEPRLLIDFTARPPAHWPPLAAALRLRGIVLCEACLPQQAAARADSLLYATEAAQSARVRHVLSVFRQPLIDCGEVGQAGVVRLVINAVGLCNRLVVNESVAVGRRLGLAEPVMATVINQGSAWSRECQRLLEPAVSPASDATLQQALCDLQALVGLGLASATPMPLLGCALQRYRSAADLHGIHASQDCLGIPQRTQD